MNTADTIQVTDKLMAGLQGFVTLVNDPHQIKAFYDLHEALQQTQPMRSFGTGACNTHDRSRLGP